MSAKNILGFTWKTVATAVVMLIVMVVISGLTLPPESIEAAPDDGAGTLLYLFVITLVNALLLNLVITQTRWRGLPLALGLTFAFYGVQTVIGQIEAIVFLTPLGERWGAGSIPALTMPLDFILSQFYIGAGTALIGIPFAILLFGKLKRDAEAPAISLNPGIHGLHGIEWLWKLAAIMVLYVMLYFGFGYYVAWKDPAILAFYQGTDPGSFLAQMKYVVTETPTLVPFQAFRALLWTAFSLPVISMLRRKSWFGALLTGIFVSIPMNIPHLVPNPYMPPAVRMAHFIETVSSTFIFGLLMFWLFHRSHRSLADLFGISESAPAMQVSSSQSGS